MQKIIKAGNSLAITIPSRFVKAVGIKLGDDVDIAIDTDHATLKLHFQGIKQLSLTKN